MQEVREQAARDAIDQYEFGEGVEVLEVGIWEHRPIANEVSCGITVAKLKSASDGGRHVQLLFTVCFAPGTDQVSDAFATDARGQQWGRVFPRTQFGAL